MLGLPKETELKIRIPRQKLYDNIDVSPKQKKQITEQIRNIYWRNKVATTTMNLEQGKTVTEIEVFEVIVPKEQIDEEILTLIDRKIPYHIVFVIRCEDRQQTWIAYKEHSTGQNPFKVEKYYQTPWMNEDIILNIEGQNTDTVYEGFIRQIAGINLRNVMDTLKEEVKNDQWMQDMQKRINALKAKIKKEKQLNKKMKLNDELKKMVKEMESSR